MYIYTWLCPPPRGTLQCKCSFRGGKTEGGQPGPWLEFPHASAQGPVLEQGRPNRDQQSMVGNRESRGVGPVLI